MKEIKASLVGFGVVGHGVMEVVKRKRSVLRDMGLDLKVVSISDHTGSIMNEAGVDADYVLKDKTLENIATSSMKGQEAIKAIDSDLVIEVTPTNVVHGQPGLGHMEAALGSGKNLVTSNKGPLVLSFSRLKKLADDNHCQFKYEATVGGTMPLMSLIERTLVGNTIYSIKGIFNGTCNYILTRMAQESISYSHALSEAQDLGYAERDPTYDVEGIDTAGKVVILANAIFGMDAKYSDVKVTGITQVTPEALAMAKKEGYVIKLIGEVPSLTVKPMLVPMESPLNVDSTLNSAAIATDLSGTITVTGFGAGSLETASAILSDIISIYR